MKKKILIVLTILTVAVLTGCSTGNEKEEGKIKVAFLFTPRGDKSVSDAVWVGAEKAINDFDIDTQFIELPTDTSKYRAAVLEASESDADLIIANAGSGMVDEMYKGAGEFPEKYYMVLDAPADMKVDHQNFVGQMFKQNEVSYLVGYLAGLQTETNTIGAIVGVEYPVLSDFLTGYLSGAEAANPSIKVSTSVVGDFQDAAKSKELAIVQYNMGADIVFNVSGPAGYGILEAAKEKGKFAIGVDIDQALQFIGTDDAQANAILTSAKKGWGEATYTIIEQFSKDKSQIKWGTVEQLGIKEGGVDIAINEIYDAHVSEENKQKMIELKEKVTSGEIEIPSFFNMSVEEYNDLKNRLKP